MIPLGTVLITRIRLQILARLSFVTNSHVIYHCDKKVQHYEGSGISNLKKASTSRREHSLPIKLQMIHRLGALQEVGREAILLTSDSVASMCRPGTYPRFIYYSHNLTVVRAPNKSGLLK